MQEQEESQMSQHSPGLHPKEKRSYPRCGKESDKEDDPQLWDRDT